MKNSKYLLIFNKQLFVLILFIFTQTTSVFAAPGDIDRSFGINGFAKTSFGVSSEKRGSILQPDGKLIVVGGIAGLNTGSDFYVIRINPNGGLDTTFDGDGEATIAVSVNYDFATNVAVQQNGKIVVSGSDNTGYYLLRYNGNGSLDNGFGVNGRA